MSTTIFYFSGTGNSLKTARDIADKLDDAKVIPISTTIREGLNLSAERIGIVFPVINLGMPLAVSKFIKKMKVSGKDPYFFAVATHGGMPGGTLLQVAARFKSQKLKLGAGFDIFFNGQRGTAGAREKRIIEIAAQIKDKRESKIVKGKFSDRALTAFGNRLALMMIPKEDKKFLINADCNGCGICRKVCPVQNIALKDEKPIWLNKCEQCAACVNWCPKRAIHGKNLAATKHYTNPDIQLSDFLEGYR